MTAKQKKIQFWGSISLIIFSFTLSLLLADGLIRIFLPQPLSGTWRVLSDSGYLINKSGNTVRHQLGNRVVQYRFNDFHLRGGPIQPQIPKILVVGDSYTFGWLLAEHDTYAYHLQKYINRDLGKETFQVLNGGAGGWGTLDYLAFIEEFGKKINPAIIVVFLNADDIGRSIKGGTQKEVKLSKLKSFVNSLPFYEWLLENSHLVQFLRNIILGQAQAPSVQNKSSIPIPGSYDLQISQEEATNLGQTLFHRLKAWCDKHEVRLFVLTTGWHFKSEQEQEKYIEPTRAFMMKAEEIFQKENIPYHDITPEVLLTINGQLEDFVIPGDGHPNERGSKLIADRAWLWLAPHLKKMLPVHK
jgi:lysophospholipase L1-like esterase